MFTPHQVLTFRINGASNFHHESFGSKSNGYYRVCHYQAASRSIFSTEATEEGPIDYDSQIDWNSFCILWRPDRWQAGLPSYLSEKRGLLNSLQITELMERNQ